MEWLSDPERPRRPWTTAKQLPGQWPGPLHCAAARHSWATSVLRNCCFSCCAGQSHRDKVRRTAAVLRTLFLWLCPAQRNRTEAKDKSIFVNLGQLRQSSHVSPCSWSASVSWAALFEPGQSRQHCLVTTSVAPFSDWSRLDPQMTVWLLRDSPGGSPPSRLDLQRAW